MPEWMTDLRMATKTLVFSSALKSREIETSKFSNLKFCCSVKMRAMAAMMLMMIVIPSYLLFAYCV